MTVITNSKQAFKKYVYADTVPNTDKPSKKAKGGLGAVDDLYYSKRYAKDKTTKVILGAVQRVQYLQWDHDREPLIIPFLFEAVYGTVMAINFHYMSGADRKKVWKFIRQGNAAIIAGENPIIIDYVRLIKAVPNVKNAIRRYKLIGTRVLDIYRVDEVEKVITERYRGPKPPMKY